MDVRWQCANAGRKPTPSSVAQSRPGLPVRDLALSLGLPQRVHRYLAPGLAHAHRPNVLVRPCARTRPPAAALTARSTARVSRAGGRTTGGARSEPHLVDVQAADEAIDRIDDLPLVNEHVVELDRLRSRFAGRRGHRPGDLGGPERIGDVEGPHAAVEECLSLIHI